MKLPTLSFLLLALSLNSCATTTAYQWCQRFCGDMKAEATETSQSRTAIATCVCHAPVEEEFYLDVEKSIGPPSPIPAPGTVVRGPYQWLKLEHTPGILYTPLPTEDRYLNYIVPNVKIETVPGVVIEPVNKMGPKP